MNFSGAAVRLNVPEGVDLLTGAPAGGEAELDTNGVMAIRLNALAAQGGMD